MNTLQIILGCKGKCLPSTRLGGEHLETCPRYTPFLHIVINWKIKE